MDNGIYLQTTGTMSESGGGGISAAALVGGGIGGCALVVGIIALALYCYMKARKEKANSNMHKSPDVFTTAASNNIPQRSRVNQYLDPEAARKSRHEKKREQRDKGHVNPAYSRHVSDSSSIGSDADGRDISPPRVRTRSRGGHTNAAFSSDSSYEDSSSVDEEGIGGSYKMEREIDAKNSRSRTSYKRAKEQDLIDGGKKSSESHRPDRYRPERESQRRSRRDDFNRRNPRSDSPLTIETLEKHEKITRHEKDDWNEIPRKERSRKRESSPSRGSETTASLVTEGTGFTGETVSSGTRFQKNPSLRRSSPSRSSSHRRYRKDSETERDSQGRRKPRRTRSGERQHKERQERRARSADSQSSASSQRSGSQRSKRQRAAEAKQINKEQAMLPIFSKASGGKSSAV